MKGYKVKGYKVFNSDWTCRGFQYEVGKSYEEDVKLEVCKSGFHFCKKAVDCFNYYSFDSDNKVAEIIAHGNIVESGDKCSTNKIEIIREVEWCEVLKIVNIGKDNTGNSNTGDRNTGDWNTGDRNTGDWNTGNWNTGYRNTGDFNLSNYNTGYFNTINHKIKFFDLETEMTIEQWRDSKAFYLLNSIEFTPTSWILETSMSEQEKINYPKYVTAGGYLKTNDLTNCNLDWWDKLSEEEKQIIKEIPNFNSDKFYKITGIKVSEVK